MNSTSFSFPLILDICCVTGTHIVTFSMLALKELLYSATYPTSLLFWLLDEAVYASACVMHVDLMSHQPHIEVGLVIRSVS